MPKYPCPIHIVAATRTPIGRLGGALRFFTAAQLGQAVARAVAGAQTPRIDSIVFGQVLQAGAGMNVARQIGLGIGLDPSVPACTVNMVCGSGLKAAALGAEAIALGDAHLVVAGGTESMSNAPYLVREARWGAKFGDQTLVDSILADGLTDAVHHVAMGAAAETLAEAYGITRTEQDHFAVRSQQRYQAARAQIAREIVPLTLKDQVLVLDEHPRPDSTVEKLAALKPAFRADGTITAGNASGVNDGAAAVLLASDAALTASGLTSRARIVASCAVGCAPLEFGLGPVGAIRALCERTGWRLNDVDAIEINEAFAVQALACQRDLGVSDSQLNPRGGAIALGHPIGCSGARVLVTLLHHMEDLDLKRGIASLCIGGGMGIALALERSVT